MFLDSYRGSCSLTATEGYVLWQLQGARSLVAAEGLVCRVCLCFWPCRPCDVVSMVDWVLNSKWFFVHIISSPVVRAHNLAECQGQKFEVVIRLSPSATTLGMNFVIIITSHTSFCSLTLSSSCLEIRVSLWARDSHVDLSFSTSSTSPLSSVCPALCHFHHHCWRLVSFILTRSILTVWPLRHLFCELDSLSDLHSVLRAVYLFFFVAGSNGDTSGFFKLHHMWGCLLPP